MENELLVDLYIEDEDIANQLNGDNNEINEPQETNEEGEVSMQPVSDPAASTKRPSETSSVPRRDWSKRPRLPSSRQRAPPSRTYQQPPLVSLPPPVNYSVPLPLPHTLLPEHRKALPSPIGPYIAAPHPLVQPPLPGMMRPYPQFPVYPALIHPAPHVPLPPPSAPTYGVPPVYAANKFKPVPHASPPMWSQDMRALNSVRPNEKARNTLKFGNIPADIKLGDLEVIFKAIGPIKSINLNTPTREGTVTYCDANTALIAKRRLHRSCFHGQNITVEFL